MQNIVKFIRLLHHELIKQESDWEIAELYAYRATYTGLQLGRQLEEICKQSANIMETFCTLYLCLFVDHISEVPQEVVQNLSKHSEVRGDKGHQLN